MRRRDVLAWLVGVAVLWPLASKAQDARKVYRVGLLWDSHAMFPKAIEALRGRRSESLHSSRYGRRGTSSGLARSPNNWSDPRWMSSLRQADLHWRGKASYLNALRTLSVAPAAAWTRDLEVETRSTSRSRLRTARRTSGLR